MREIGFCEEKGSGIDKVVTLCERYQLPGLVLIIQTNHTKIILSSRKNLKDLSKGDRILACYQHCALKYVANQRMTNKSLRVRFKIGEHNLATASRIIKDTINKGLIKDEDPNAGKKFARYIPFWG